MVAVREWDGRKERETTIEIKGKKEEVDTVVTLLENTGLNMWCADCKVTCEFCPMRDDCATVTNAILTYTDEED